MPGQTQSNPAAGAGQARGAVSAAPYTITIHDKLIQHGRHHRNLVILEITLARPISPAEAVDIAHVAYQKIQEYMRRRYIDILVINGRGPIWLHEILLHALIHVIPIIATYDPKLRGAVVVAAHSPLGPYTGEVIPLEA